MVLNSFLRLSDEGILGADGEVGFLCRRIAVDVK